MGGRHQESSVVVISKCGDEVNILYFVSVFLTFRVRSSEEHNIFELSESFVPKIAPYSFWFLLLYL